MNPISEPSYGQPQPVKQVISAIEAARIEPQTADMRALWASAEGVITQLPQPQQLRAAADLLLALTELYFDRANFLYLLLEQWYTGFPRGPVLDNQEIADLLVRQSLQLDLDDLISHAPYKYQHAAQAETEDDRVASPPQEGDSVVGEIDSALLLEKLDDLIALDREQQQLAAVKSLAHEEPIAEWAAAISHHFESSPQTLLLPHLARVLGMNLIEVWIGCLMRPDTFECERVMQPGMDEAEAFYDPLSLWVKPRATIEAG